MPRIETYCLVVLTCITLGISPSSFSAESRNEKGILGMRILSFFRSYQTPVVEDDIAANESLSSIHHRYAKNYAEQGDIYRADTHFGVSLKSAKHSQMTPIAHDYAALLLETGNFPKAELVLRQALTLSPQDRELTEMLARSLVLQEKVIEGLRYLKSFYSEEEAKGKVASIYHEQGNYSMVAVCESTWGLPTTRGLEQKDTILMASFAAVPTLPNKQRTETLQAPTPGTLPIMLTASESSIIPITPPKPAMYSKPKLPASQVNATPTDRQVVKFMPVGVVLPTENVNLDQKISLSSESKVVQAYVKNGADSAKPTVMLRPRRHYILNAATPLSSSNTVTIMPSSAVMSVR